MVIRRKTWNQRKSIAIREVEEFTKGQKRSIKHSDENGTIIRSHKGHKASTGKFRRLEGPIQTSENLVRNYFSAENRRLLTDGSDVCFCLKTGKYARQQKQTSGMKNSDG